MSDEPIVQIFVHNKGKQIITAQYGVALFEQNKRAEIAVELRQVKRSAIKGLQESLSTGDNSVSTSFLESSILLSGDIAAIKNKINQVDPPYYGLLLRAVENYENQHNELNWAGLQGTPAIMGIVNVTPDSFSDGGKYFSKEAAIHHAVNLLKEGADIIDIGGESTRPGSSPVSLEEEQRRTIPIISEIKKHNPDAVISIDTTKAKVAEAALLAGAAIVNDISGGTFDPEILDVTADHGASIVLMHTKNRPKVMQNDTNYSDLVREIYDFLYIQIQRAKSVGIEQVAVDPGIGFGKTPGQNWELLDRISDFQSLGCPVLIGLSRKSFLGKLLGLEAGERDTATGIAETAAVLNGTGIIRTHNVRNAVQMKKILTALKENRQ